MNVYPIIIASNNLGDRLRLSRSLHTCKLEDESGEDLTMQTSMLTRTSPLFASETFLVELNTAIDENQKLGISVSERSLNKIFHYSNSLGLDLEFTVDSIGNTSIKGLNIGFYCNILENEDDKSVNIFLTNSKRTKQNFDLERTGTLNEPYGELFISAFEIIEIVKSEVKNIYKDMNHDYQYFEFKILDYRKYENGLSVFPNIGDLGSIFRTNDMKKKYNIQITFNEYTKENKLEIGMINNSGINLVTNNKTLGTKDYFFMNLTDTSYKIELEELKAIIRNPNLSEAIPKLNVDLYNKTKIIFCSNAILEINILAIEDMNIRLKRKP